MSGIPRLTVKEMIYICSPFRGDTQNNIEQAQRICHRVAMKQFIPFAPHLYFPQFLNDDNPQEREFGIETALEMMNMCSELWVFGDVISDGMKAEITHASKTGRVVKFFGTECDI